MNIIETIFNINIFVDYVWILVFIVYTSLFTSESIYNKINAFNINILFNIAKLFFFLICVPNNFGEF